MVPLLALLPSLGPQEMLVLLILGVLLFGKRLPEIGRHVGKGIVEFKKGLKGVEDDVGEGNATSAPAAQPEPTLDKPRPPQRITTSVPKFEDEPVAAAQAPVSASPSAQAPTSAAPAPAQPTSADQVH
jgi:sec-independent protein translocase protein TatA